MKKLDSSVIGDKFLSENIDNKKLIDVNKKIRSHPIEKIGKILRESMINMKKINS